MTDEPLATIRRHQDIVEVFRLAKAMRGLTNEFVDDVGGLTKGHTDKILGPTEFRSWGPTTFDLFCELFAIEFRVYVDEAAAKRMADVWEGRKRAVEISETRRISVKLIEKAKPHVIASMARAGGTASGAKRTGSQGSEIMRKLAKKGWRKRRKAAHRARMRTKVNQERNHAALS